MGWQRINTVSRDENWSDTTYIPFGDHADRTIGIIGRRRPTYRRSKRGWQYEKGKGSRTAYVVTRDGRDVAEYKTLKAAKEAAEEIMDTDRQIRKWQQDKIL